MTYSCSVKVLSVTPQDFGAVAEIEFVQGGGIDISPGDGTNSDAVLIHITEDVTFVQEGAVLKLSLGELVSSAT